MNYGDFFRLARDYGRYGILDNKKKLWFFRILAIVVVVLLLCRLFGIFSFALTTSTYNDTLGSSTTCNNLLSLIPSNSAYVVFQNSDSSYYCFYGEPSDFETNNNVISGNNLNYVSYIRTGTYGTYSYNQGTDNLRLTVNNVIASNLKNDLLSSVNFNYYSTSIQHISFIAMLVFFPIIMITNIRRLGREYY